MESKLAFFCRRSAEEYLAHANAGHVDDQRSHRALAEYYEALARAEAEQSDPEQHQQLDESRGAETAAARLRPTSP
jgi:hypothetical protein